MGTRFAKVGFRGDEPGDFGKFGIAGEVKGETYSMAEGDAGWRGAVEGIAGEF